MARATTRAFEAAVGNKSLSGVVMVDAASQALLMGDLKAGSAALQQGIQQGADEEDQLYAALWVDLLARSLKAKPVDLASRTIAQTASGRSWVALLAQWTLGKFDDQSLITKAKDVPQRTEAAFYVAMRKRLAADPEANAALAKVAQSPAFDLVEVFLARELTAPTSSWGAPPVALP